MLGYAYVTAIVFLQPTVTSTNQLSTSIQESAEDTVSQDSVPDTVPRTPPPKSGVMGSATATTPTASHATSAPVNIPSPNLLSVSTAAILSSSSSVRASESTGATNSLSPVNLSTSVKEEDVGSFPGHRSSPSFADAGLVRGIGRGGLGSQPPSTIPISSGNLVTGNNALGAVSSASDMGKRNILGADERIGSSSMVQHLVSPLSSRMILPQAAKSNDVVGSLDSSNVSEAAALAGRAFSPSMVSGWRPGGEAVCYFVYSSFLFLS